MSILSGNSEFSVTTEHSYSVLSGDICPNNEKANGWEEFDHIICKFLKEQNVPGAGVAISRNGTILYQQGYGIAGASRRVNHDSMFRIASISKPITASIVLKLCDSMKVPLNTKVFGKAGILKSYKTRDRRMKNITIRHLLQHSAGWDRDKVGDAVFVRPQCVLKEHPDSQAYNAALLAHALRRKLQFFPALSRNPTLRGKSRRLFNRCATGTVSKWHSYSNLGYLVLGEVIEALSGRPYPEVMRASLQDLDIHDVVVGNRKRTSWTSKEAEYFNNREPQVVSSIYPGESEALPQYGGMAMESSGSYGGLVSDTVSLLKFVHSMEKALAEPQAKEYTGTSSSSSAFPGSGLIPKHLSSSTSTFEMMLSKGVYSDAKSHHQKTNDIMRQDCSSHWPQSFEVYGNEKSISPCGNIVNSLKKIGGPSDSTPDMTRTGSKNMGISAMTEGFRIKSVQEDQPDACLFTPNCHEVRPLSEGQLPKDLVECEVSLLEFNIMENTSEFYISDYNKLCMINKNDWDISSKTLYIDTPEDFDSFYSTISNLECKVMNSKEVPCLYRKASDICQSKRNSVHDLQATGCKLTNKADPDSNSGHSFQNLHGTCSKLTNKDVPDVSNSTFIQSLDYLSGSDSTCRNSMQILHDYMEADVLANKEDADLSYVSDSSCRKSLEYLNGLSSTCTNYMKCLYDHPEADTVTRPLLPVTLAKESLSRPDYENGSDWYGLGWDVQDNGKSWGHTGGMEGSCGTLFHHESGLNWAFLLNSWAMDCDLNGVMKCALCSVPGLMMYNPNILSFDRDQGVRIVTLDKSQIIYLCASESAILNIISELKTKCYLIKWISIMNQDISNTASSLLQGGSESEPLQNRFLGTEKPQRKYFTIFQESQFQEYFILFNKTTTELKSDLEKHKKDNFEIYFLDSFVDSQFHLKFTAVFIYKNPLISCETIVLLAMKAADYVSDVKKYVERHYVIIVQSVTEVCDQLYVSAILSHSQSSPMEKISYDIPHTFHNNRPSISNESTDILLDIGPPSKYNLDIRHSNSNKNSDKFNIKMSIKSINHSINIVNNIQETIEDTCHGKCTTNNLREEIKVVCPGNNFTNNLTKPMKDCSFAQDVVHHFKLSSLKKKSRKALKVPSLSSIYWVQISPESFLTELNRQIKRKSCLLYAKFYTAEKKPFVSGCWLPEREGNCYHRIAMSKYGIVPELVEAASKNIYLQSLSEYNEEDRMLYYAAIWHAT